MDWDAVGAAGEILGALAVMITLAYLSLQIRAMRRESEAGALAVYGQHASSVRERLIEHTDLWTKANSGGALTQSERFAFDELAELVSVVPFYAFRRATVLGFEGNRLHVPASTLAEFLHRFPAAHERWQAWQEAYRTSRHRIGITSTHLADKWHRMVTEAVSALESTDGPQ